MHEGKHGILDGIEDMDDLFGMEDEEDNTSGKKDTKASAKDEKK